MCKHVTPPGRVMCRIGGMTPEGLTSEMWCLSLAGTVTWLRLKQVFITFITCIVH